MSYSPDVWIVVQITNKKAGLRIHKILAGWYGGFAGSDSWRLNSGITEVKKDPENENVYQVYGGSGSVYYCHKNVERTSMLTQSVLSNMQESADESGDYEVTQVPIESLVIGHDTGADPV